MKVLFLFIVGVMYINAADNYELKLYEKVLPLFFEKEPIRVYADKDTSKVLQKSSKFQIIEQCDNSVHLLIGRSFPDLSDTCRKKPLFSTSYRVYRSQKNSFGAFYWRKGRPQLKFKKHVLEYFKIKIPKNLARYVEE